MNSVLRINNVNKNEDISFEELQGCVSKKDLNLIKSAINGGQNLIISGMVGAGKTTVMEAVIREHLTSVPTVKNLYLPLSAEMSFGEDDSVLTLERYSKGSLVEISKSLVLAHAFGVKTVFVEELRSESDYMAVLEALENNVQVVFTMHAMNVEVAMSRIKAHIGEELGDKFISHFNHIISCTRNREGVRSFNITTI